MFQRTVDRRDVGTSYWIYQKMYNTLIEAELLTNKRPLTHTPIDPNDQEPLTPNMALLVSQDSTQALCLNEDRNNCAKLGRRRVQKLGSKISTALRTKIFVSDYQSGATKS